MGSSSSKKSKETSVEEKKHEDIIPSPSVHENEKKDINANRENNDIHDKIQVELPSSTIDSSLSVEQLPTLLTTTLPTTTKVPSPTFAPISLAHRAVTFDERTHLASSAGHFTLESRNFRPLSRAATFDTRTKNTNPSFDGVEDVLHRRYFNLKASRSTINALPKVQEEEEVSKMNKGCIVIVDPFSTGIVVAQRILARGYACICVYSDTLQVMKELIAHVPDELASQFTAIVHHDASLVNAMENTISFLKQFDIKEVIAGAETGVPLTDALSETLKVRTNGSSGSEGRRNKYTMGETIRAGGLRAVSQCSATTWSQVVTFIEDILKPISPFEVIVKPVESAGSDDVTLCHSMQEVQQAFGNIQGKINSLGLENKATLIQEYLSGIEYVVDTVSRDGVHKVVAVWQYDKRVANASSFVYYGVILKAVDNDLMTSIVDYVLNVCTVLGISNGPGHAEVKLSNGKPCLVEIGARCHGGEGTYICIVDECLGYNQVDACLDSYLDEEAFTALPDMPLTLKRYGCESMMVSYVHGHFTGFSGLETIRSLPSYLNDRLYLHTGDTITPTIDMFTTPGSIMLLHDSKEQLTEDYEMIRKLEHDGLYAYTLSPETPLKKTIIVVDPFSTGAILARKIYDRGYACLCVYSDALEKMEKVTALIPNGLTLQFIATVAHEGDLTVTLANIAKRASEDGLEIIGVLPGAETGVRLSDAIGEALGCSFVNDIEHTCARRDKFEMGETLRRGGLRAVKQCKASTWEEAKTFIENELVEENGDLKCVLKPLESAGSDDVILVTTVLEAESIFKMIFGKNNELGLCNTAVLIQEYLSGVEYVIDTVSRNGVHKVIAVWQYDKRAVNGAAFVYFGVRMIPANTQLVKDLIVYQLQVLDCLGIRSGPSHGEVKHCKGEPVLIEVGARAHGGEGTFIPIANACVGYNQVDATLDALLDAEQWETFPDTPDHLLAHGCLAILVSYQRGILHSMPGFVEIENFSSFISKEIFVKDGQELYPTIDIFTAPASVMLVHKEVTVLENHLDRIRELEHSGLFQLKNL